MNIKAISKRRRGAGPINGRRPVFHSFTLLAGVSMAAIVALPGAAPSSAAGQAALPRAAASAGIRYPGALPPGLLRPGEQVTLWALAQTVSGKHPAGVAYVRGGTSGRFTRLAMTYSDAGYLTAKVPARFLKSSIFEDYVVIRDPAGGEPVTVPSAGAAAPYRSWIVSHPATIALGAHTFGDIRKPQAIVARASVGSGPGQVGIYVAPGNYTSYGPSSVDVARDGTVWVADRVNNRVFAYAPGKSSSPALTVNLPTYPLDLGLAPNGRLYVMTGIPGGSQYPRKVYAFTAKGARLWAHKVTGYLFNPVMRVDRDGIPWIGDYESGWIPVTDRTGHPLTIAQQIRRTVAYQQLGGGLQLPSTGVYPVEDRIGLATTSGTLRHCWRLTSRTTFQPMWPQARAGSDIVEYADVQKPITGGYEHEYMVIRFSAAGKILDKVSLNPALNFGAEPYFDFVRVGQDGKLYYLQTSGKWGMRVARYNWRGR